MHDIIYLDNAATSFPKPGAVLSAVSHYLSHASANPGRSGHRLSAQAARIVYEARAALAALLGIRDARQLVFTANATGAINLALLGLLRPGDHVVTTSMEHNSVMRPLRRLRERADVNVTVVRSGQDGTVDPVAIGAAVRRDTRLVVINHASNVVGTIAPLAEIRAAIGQVPLLVDGAQTVGALPLGVEDLGIDLLAFSGHKALLGPQGIGVLYIRPGLTLEPLTLGGTGSDSESDAQPEALPDRYESGTPNGVGIAGLGAAATFLMEQGLDAVRQRETDLLRALLAGMRRIEGVTIHGQADPVAAVPIVSVTVRGLSPSEVAYRLDRRHGIMTRAGLHCAPAAHRTLGTFPGGTVRISPGYMNRLEDVGRAVSALEEIAAEVVR